MRLAAGVASDRGLVRQTNEDSYLVRPGLYAVCDGMGGARAGEVASQMACEALLQLDPAAAGKEGLRQAIVTANEAIAARSLSEERLSGMGTTLTAALAGEDHFLVGHVGDSRAYLLHEGELTQLTDDHSWVGEMVRRGEITQAEAAVHPHRSIITRALGTDTDIEPDLSEVPVAPGDRLLICSDGLSGMVSDGEIADLLGRRLGPEEVAGLLVQAALAGGGEDNVTVLVVDVMGADVSANEDAPREEEEVLLGPVDRGEPAEAPSRAKRPGMAWQRLGRAAPFSRPPANEKAAGTSAEPRTDAPRAPSRRRLIISAVLVVLLLAALVGGFTAFNSSVFYVGTYEGMVALYQGLPASLLGIQLSSVIEIGTVAYDSLPAYLQQRVDAHDLLDKEEGRAFLQTLGALP
jgi:protein phosphatase